ncbi:hypothetical protein GTQ34_09280 [Muricauda sp. JGD-17]|uniref:Uncharacterized protein n=1 Tax=Flagellimonas ochracea TaxID=2696472 RepID=A0A964WXG6_9FLAO|nr:hypothetical protein [Allomuricauda ochracea]NAY92111.1 hypothetical protein [Allomuricauda ochracea]
MVQPYKLATRIQKAKTFQAALFGNYIEFSNGTYMNEYVENERKILAMGYYGVEEYHSKVNEYLKFLDEVILN